MGDLMGLQQEPEDISTEAATAIENIINDNATYAQAASSFLNDMVERVHAANEQWWIEPTTGEHLLSNEVYAPYVIGTKLALVHSEISEATEGYRKDQMDDKILSRKMIEVELVDVIIRVFDLAGVLGLDLGGAYVEKMEMNAVRPDHKHENRIKKGGKKF